MESKELLEELKQYTVGNIVHMYIIERKIKPGARRNEKASEKFEYIPLQLNLSQELLPIVQKMLTGIIEKKEKRDVVIKEYTVIDDSEEKIMTYNDFDKIAGFQDFLQKRLGVEIPTITSLEELEDIEKAWALCYGFYDDNKKDWLYCIKKHAPRHIAVDAEVSTSIKEAIKNGVFSAFDLNTKELKPFSGFTLNIEPSIDLIYWNGQILIFRKKGFEDLTSLTEEFEAFAVEIVADVEEIGFIEGIAYLSKIVIDKPMFRNRLIKAKSIGNLDFLKNCKNIKKEFSRAGKKLDIKFKFDKEGKILAENEQDAEDILRVISEYFKEGIFGGQVFESPAGRLKK